MQIQKTDKPVYTTLARIVIIVSIFIIGTSSSVNANGDYLIIAHDSFVNSVPLNTFVFYRTECGFTPFVKPLSTIYSQFPHDSGYEYLSIKDFIQYAYDNWPIPPEYVVLIGDASFKGYNSSYTEDNLMPLYPLDTQDYHDGGGYYEAFSDGLFTCVEGNDSIPDIPVGRLPVENSTELDNYVDKLLAYENLPPASWENDFFFLLEDYISPQTGGEGSADHEEYVSFLYSIYEECNDILGIRGLSGSLSRMRLTNPDPPPEYLPYPNPDAKDEFTNLIRNGGLFSFITGVVMEHKLGNMHCSWCDLVNVGYLNNEDKYPIFLGPTCVLGRFYRNEEFSITYRSIYEELVIAEQEGGVAAYGFNPIWVNVTEAWPIVRALLYQLAFNTDITLGDAIIKSNRNLLIARITTTYYTILIC